MFKVHYNSGFKEKNKDIIILSSYASRDELFRWT